MATEGGPDAMAAGGAAPVSECKYRNVAAGYQVSGYTTPGGEGAVGD